ncbi:MAG: hypothetical protein IKQ72_10750 [Bacteroidaceae bacterium]|nr:hypothetical protein [Bacteroidaceae bacterium]
MCTKKIIMLLLFAVIFPVSYAQERVVTHGDMYFFYGILGGKKHNERFQISWLIPGMSNRNILKDMDFSNEDDFIYRFNDLTYYIDYGQSGLVRLMKEWNEFDNYSKWDSIYWNVKDIFKSVKVPEYKIILGDSTELYLKVYKLNGEYWKNDKLFIGSRNPYRSKYYQSAESKGMYTLINLYSAKGVTLKKRQIKRLKGVLSCCLVE